MRCNASCMSRTKNRRVWPSSDSPSCCTIFPSGNIWTHEPSSTLSNIAWIIYLDSKDGKVVTKTLFPWTHQYERKRAPGGQCQRHASLAMSWPQKTTRRPIFPLYNNTLDYNCKPPPAPPTKAQDHQLTVRQTTRIASHLAKLQRPFHGHTYLHGIILHTESQSDLYGVPPIDNNCFIT